ncbi:MAG: hypothetical protein ACREMX_05005 [Gemmatimonadales bacterium]
MSPARLAPPLRATRREARLRSEYAALYPGIRPDEWESAAILADRVLADRLRRGMAPALCDRALLGTHFEFRGGRGGEGARPRREDR